MLLERLNAERGIMTVRDPAGLRDGEGGRVGLRAAIALDEFAKSWEAGGFSWVFAKQRR